MPSKRAAERRGGAVFGGDVGHRRGGRHVDEEARTAAGHRLDFDGVAEDAADTLDDRQAEAETAGDLGALIEPLELLEDHLLLALGDAEAGVEHLDREAAAMVADADEDAAFRRVLDRVGDEVLDEAAQQTAVGAHPQGRGHDAEIEVAVAGDRLELDAQLLEDVVDAEDGELGLERPGVEAGDVEQRPEDLLDRIERLVDVDGVGGERAVLGLLHQRGGVEAGGVERLQDVVAGGGEELGLADVGVVGLGLGARQLGVEAGQFLGALAHPALQSLVGARQRLGRADAFGDVGPGGDDAAVRHRRGAHFDHRIGGGEALVVGLHPPHQAVDAVLDDALGVAGAEFAALGAVADDRLQGHPDLGELRRQIEDLAELAVPTDQAELAIEHRDALADLIESDLQQVAVVLDGGGGVVEQLHRRLGRGVASLDQERQHQPRRGGADRRGEQLLGEAQEMQIGLPVPDQRHRVGAAEIGEGAGGAFLAEIARHGRDQIVDGDGGAPAPQRRGRGEVGGDEDVGLEPLDRLGRAHQRHGDEGEGVEQQAPEHPVGERIEGEREQRLRAQRPEAEGSVLQQRRGAVAGLDEGGDRQSVDPHGEADQHAGDGAARRAAPPEQAAEEGRGELSDGGEGEQADVGERRGVGDGAVIAVGEQQDDEDRHPPHGEQQPHHVGGAILETAIGPHQDRHHQFVADHHGERQRGDDHHRGGGRQTADEGDHGDGVGAGIERQAQHEGVGVDGGAVAHQACHGDRHDEDVDRDQIGREHPARRAELGRGVVLDDGDVEHPRQQDHREERQQRHHDPIAARQAARQHVGADRIAHHRIEEIGGAGEEDEDDIDADGGEGDELDRRFRRHRQHQSRLMFGGVDVAGAEEAGEGRHRQGDGQGHVGMERRRHAGHQAEVEMGDERLDRVADRLQLQGDVGNDADEGDHRDDGGEALILAVAGGDEVGDRGDALGLGELDHPPQDREAEDEEQDRPDVDGEEIEAFVGRQSDRAEEGPRGAIDPERQGIDGGTARYRGTTTGFAIAVIGDSEQQADVGDCDCEDEPALKHGSAAFLFTEIHAGTNESIRRNPSQRGAAVHRGAVETVRTAGKTMVTTRFAGRATQFRDGNIPISAIQVRSGAPVAVKIGFIVGSAKVVWPLPPYLVPIRANSASFWAIGSNCPWVSAHPFGQ